MFDYETPEAYEYGVKKIQFEINGVKQDLKIVRSYRSQDVLRAEIEFLNERLELEKMGLENAKRNASNNTKGNIKSFPKLWECERI